MHVWISYCQTPSQVWFGKQSRNTSCGQFKGLPLAVSPPHKKLTEYRTTKGLGDSMVLHVSEGRMGKRGLSKTPPPPPPNATRVHALCFVLFSILSRVKPAEQSVHVHDQQSLTMAILSTSAGGHHGKKLDACNPKHRHEKASWIGSGGKHHKHKRMPSNKSYSANDD